MNDEAMELLRGMAGQLNNIDDRLKKVENKKPALPGSEPASMKANEQPAKPKKKRVKMPRSVFQDYGHDPWSAQEKKEAVGDSPISELKP